MLNWDDEKTAVTPASGAQHNAMRDPAEWLSDCRRACRSSSFVGRDIFAGDFAVAPMRRPRRFGSAGQRRRQAHHQRQDRRQPARPFKYKWAWEKYLAGCANHWMPQEINMSATSRSGRIRTLTRRAPDRQAQPRFLRDGRFARANNIVLGTYRHITAPSAGSSCCARRSKEAIHTHAYQ
ncbi:hypothetical protein [Burkholderia mallei]|uniref:hypothetical protein n=1 Tax=Burkholderia mallei TaxID=13373 RepID=UPI001EF039A9|nr:hypothetical protein [Burkholderia mallei]